MADPNERAPRRRSSVELAEMRRAQQDNTDWVLASAAKDMAGARLTRKPEENPLETSPPQKDLSMLPFQSLTGSNGNSGFAHEATIFAETHPVEKIPVEEPVAVKKEKPRQPLWRDDDPASTLFKGLPDIRELFAGLGNIDSTDTTPPPPPKEKKDTSRPTLPEKAFLTSFLSDYQNGTPVNDTRTIAVATTDPQRRRLVEAVTGKWASNVSSTPSRLEMKFKEHTFKALFLALSEDAILSNPELLPPYLVGKMKRREKRFERKIIVKDADQAGRFLTAGREIFGQEIGVSEKTHSGQSHTYTMVLHENIPALLRENEAVKGMRFWEEIFPEEREKRRLREAFFRGYTIQTFTKQELGNGTRYDVTANTENPLRKEAFRIIMENWGRVISSPSQVRVDIPIEKVPFRNASFEEVATSNKEDVAFLAGAWLAQGLPQEFEVINETIVARLAASINDQLGENLVHIRFSQKRLAITAFNRQRVISGLKKVLSGALPFFDEVFPQSA